MTLGFSTQINGKPTEFMTKIWKGLLVYKLVDLMDFIDMHSTNQYDIYDKVLCALKDENIKPKIHTLRADMSDRWRKGNIIDFVIKNRTPGRFQFAPKLPCKSTQEVVFYTEPLRMHYTVPYDPNNCHHVIKVDGKEIKNTHQFAYNDGFASIKELFDFIYQDTDRRVPTTFKLIHWTDFKY